jgi:F-type H+-transporting ATPase subunit b
VFILLAQHALAVEDAAASADGIAALGLSGWALLWQILNFVILLALLRLFVYPRIVKVLESRRQTIAEGLTTAAEMGRAKAELAIRQQAVLKAAREEAQVIIQEGRAQSKEILLEGQAAARQQAEAIIDAAQVEITQSLVAAKKDLKKEAAELVTVATEQIIKQRLDEAGDEELIGVALDEAAKHIHTKSH